MTNSVRDEAPLYPVDRSFVLQIQHDTVAASNSWRGRIEHLTSGEAVVFGTLAEMMEFIDALLTGPAEQTSPT